MPLGAASDLRFSQGETPKANALLARAIAFELLRESVFFWLTRDVDHAEAILAVRSHLRKHSNLPLLVQDRQLPIYTLKANTIPEITGTLRQVLEMDEPDTIDQSEPSRFAQTGSSDKLDALEEARRAVEQIVIPQG